jgi:hypothetical protein
MPAPGQRGTQGSPNLALGWFVGPKVPRLAVPITKPGPSLDLSLRYFAWQDAGERRSALRASHGSLLRPLIDHVADSIDLPVYRRR